MRKPSSRIPLIGGLALLSTLGLYAPSASAQLVSPSHRAATSTTATAIPSLIVVKVPDSYSTADAAALAASVGATIYRAIPYSPHYFVFKLTSAVTPSDTSAATPSGVVTRAATTRAAGTTPVGDDVKAAVAALIKVSGVKAAPDYYVRPTQVTSPTTPTTPTTPVTTVPVAPAVTGPELAVTSNDPLFYPSNLTTTGQTWNMDMIHMPQAWAIQTNAIGRPVIVGVIDTGLDVGHPDIADHVAPGGLDFTPLLTSATAVASTTIVDQGGHGTHCSGIVAAVTNNGLGVTGVGGWNRNNVQIQVLPERVFDANELSSDDIIIAAINYGVTAKVDVLSMSLGAGPEPALDLTTDPFYAALLAATNSGVTVVVAAGNDGLEAGTATGLYFYPANYPNVINVSSVGPARTLASYSNYGNNVTIAAPGGDDPTFSDPSKMVLSTFSRLPEAIADLQASGYPILPVVGYECIQGTSMACPHVSGAVALLIAAGAPEDPVLLKSVLQLHAQPLDEVPSLAGNNKYGAGLLDVYASLASLTTLNPGFTAQIADVVDNEITATPATTSFPAEGSTGYSLVGSEPYTDRGLSYIRPQSTFAIRYLGRPSLIDATGVDHPEYVTLDISPATLPSSILRHFVGSTVNTATTFALPSLVSGSNAASVQTVNVPSTATLNLPDGNYRATLKVFDATPSVNAYRDQGVVFFEVASHTQPAGLTMFSSPFQVDASVVGTLPPELFEFGTSSNFTLERYNAQRLPTDLEYAVYSPTPNTVQDLQAEFATPRALDGSPLSYFITSSSTSIAPIGLGYWLNLNSDVILNPTGNVITSAIAVKAYAANGGWNMIGDPYTYSILWPSISVLTTNGQSYSLADAASLGIISPAIVGYSGGQYVYSIAPSGTLDPFQGYWVRVFQDCSLILAPTSTGAGRAAHASSVATRAAGVHTSTLPAIDGWRARLSATVAGDRDGENYFGVLRSTKLSEPFYDIAKPPSGGGHAYLRFTKPDVSGKAEVYAMDMRTNSNAVPNELWNAEVSTDKTDSPVTLSWDGLGNVPHGSRLYLKDMATGQKVSMNARSSYTFSSGVAGSTHRFQLSVERELSGGGLAITGFQVVPGGRATGRSMAFQFTANRDADVTASVHALNGRFVANVSGAETRAEAARQTILHWNGRKPDGSAIPPGMYFIEVTLTTPDGQKATVKQPFTSLN